MEKKSEPMCICETCPRRFICFTQKKVFSDPAHQGMYEAFLEEGLTSPEAARQVRDFIERQQTRKVVGTPSEPDKNEKPWEWHYNKDDLNDWYKDAFETKLKQYKDIYGWKYEKRI